MGISVTLAWREGRANPTPLARARPGRLLHAAPPDGRADGGQPGERWVLVREPSGLPAVLHRAAGRTRRLEVGSFLASPETGPAREALLRLIAGLADGSADPARLLNRSAPS